MGKSKITSILIIVLLAASLITFGFICSASAQESTILKIIAPEEIGPPGTDFTVSVVAEDIPADNGMYGWEFILTWT
ncbi:hypothetical protein J7L49_01630, partial [Candidatus Bathyarchaeota archaeon]|nr:hypothetical protein [Candidatus Bathyarchaeota archaeon]